MGLTMPLPLTKLAPNCPLCGFTMLLHHPADPFEAVRWVCRREPACTGELVTGIPAIVALACGAYRDDRWRIMTED